MRIYFDSGLTRRFKVGEMLPFGLQIKKVEWGQDDILPDRVKFDEYMKTEVFPRFVTSFKPMLFTAEVGPSLLAGLQDKALV